MKQIQSRATRRLFIPKHQGRETIVTVNPHQHAIFLKLKQRGVTLVELMVALAIGTLIALAITTLFFQVFSGYRSTDEGARANEGGNFGLRVLSEDLRMAGFFGLFNDPARVEVARANMISGSSSDNCGTADWALQLVNTTTNKLGYIEQFTNPASLPCIPASGFVAGNPAIVIRRASGIQATAADLTTNNLFIQSSQSGAIIFMGKDYASQVEAADRSLKVCRYSQAACPATPDPVCGCTTHGATSYAGVSERAPIFQYQAHVYYIRPCSRPAGATCAATDDGGQPIPTLVRRQLSNTDPAVFVETPIAEGVERMTLSYGMSGNAAGVPDSYTANPTDIGNAVTVRLSLLMRTRKPDNKYTDTATYTLADGTTFTCNPVVPDSCKYRRYLLSDTIQLKNYALRR